MAHIVLHLFKRVYDGIVIAPAEAGDKAKIFLRGFFGGGEDRAHTGSTSMAMGFSQKTCLLPSMHAAR